MFSKTELNQKTQFLDKTKARRSQRMAGKHKEDSATLINVMYPLKYPLEVLSTVKPIKG